jgi:hypothetical protein
VKLHCLEMVNQVHHWVRKPAGGLFAPMVRCINFPLSPAAIHSVGLEANRAVRKLLSPFALYLLRCCPEAAVREVSTSAHFIEQGFLMVARRSCN